MPSFLFWVFFNNCYNRRRSASNAALQQTWPETMVPARSVSFLFLRNFQGQYEGSALTLHQETDIGFLGLGIEHFLEGGSV